jgi:hypothetical protein
MRISRHIRKNKKNISLTLAYKSLTLKEKYELSLEEFNNKEFMKDIST